MDTLVEVTVRTALCTDLDPLAEAFGQRPYFSERLRSQADGHGVLLLALVGEEPVGDVYLKFEGHTEDLLLRELAGMPLLTRLEVVEPLRNRGIGSALLRYSEQVLSARGFPMVVLGVHQDNKDAIRLYERFGYRAYSDENRVITTVAYRWDDAGTCHVEDEECVIFVKDLPALAGEQVGDQ